MLDEHELVESLNGVFDRGERVDRVLQLLFMGSFAFVAIFNSTNPGPLAEINSVSA